MSLFLLPSPPLAVILGAGKCFEPSSLAFWRNTVVTGQADKMVGTMSKSNSESCFFVMMQVPFLWLWVSQSKHLPTALN